VAELPELLRSLAAAFWAWVPPAALQGGALLVLAGLADRLLPRQTAPELREAVWALALAKLLVPPGLASPLALLPPAPLPLTLDPLLEDPAAWALPVALLWLLGVVAVGLGFAVRSARARAALARLRTPASAADREALAAAQARLAVRRPVALYRLPGEGSPFVLGGRRPTIYLPSSVGSAERTHVLLHELAHVARWDGLRQAALRGLQALFWFHPLLPWARRRLAAAAEAACDRRVARALGAEASAYRATLLDFYRRSQLAAPVGVGFLAPPTVLRLRLEAIASAGRPSSRLRQGVAALVLAGAAALLLPMAAVAEQRSREVAEWIVRPPGCLQLRYLVLQRLAQEAEKASGSAQTER
jgi:beta-lactamase regulating signal transducer with metallopeptidase domain